ncbi:MAG: tetratricopeptide repeat protein [Deltaproteobacteria bacterium]|nr:tetratricopeptide repeat protein [Deltaproteobacteria bacterium]
MSWTSRLRASSAPVGLGAALVALGLVAYGPVLGFGFVSLDDAEYVRDNPVLRMGLTWESLRWALRATVIGNWMPVTYSSYLLECSLFCGAEHDAGAHHLAGLAYHLAAAIVLFRFLARATRLLVPSFLVAALFTVHPVHQESVAWISERKDVLFALFGFLALDGYVSFVRKPSAPRYAAVAGWLALGLMSKPMLATLPFLLLVLDFWPLRRPERPRRLVLEKGPLLLLSAAAVVFAIHTLRAAGATPSIEEVPISTRAMNVATSYVRYLGLFAWVTPRSFLHPMRVFSASEVALAVLVLGAASTLSAMTTRRAPMLIVGWLWFVGTLFPVSGVVQLGGHSVADRYAYFPFVGLYVALAFGASGWVGARPRLVFSGSVAAVIATFLLTWTTRTEVPRFADGVALYTHALSAYPSNDEIALQLAVAADFHGNPRGAEEQLDRVLAKTPRLALAWLTKGRLRAAAGDSASAELAYDRAISSGSTWIVPMALLGRALARSARGDLVAGLSDLDRADSLMPKDARIMGNRGMIKARLGDLDGADADLEESLRLSPGNPITLLNRAQLRRVQGRFSEAKIDLDRAVQLEPKNLAIVRAREQLSEELSRVRRE